MSSIANGIHGRRKPSQETAPSGPAGGDLSGTYPDPEIGASVITDAHIATDAAIAAGKIDLSATDLPLTASSQFLRTGAYYTTPWAGALGTGIPGNGGLRVVPFVVAATTTFDRIRVDCTIVGGAGALIRLGIYADDGTSYPGALVLDAGTVVGTSTGIREITISQALIPGLYWLGYVCQGAPSPAPTVNTNGNWSAFVGDNVASPSAVRNAYTQAGVTGALPANFSTTVAATVGAVVLLRAA